MTTFLELIANDLYKELGGDFTKTTIIFPNKRANLFFNNSLAKISDAPIFAPEYLSIGEVFASLSDRIICDQIQLVCRLYEAFHSVTKTEETLDKFYSWGEMMLSDFEDIDNNMAEASNLFINIAQLQEMTSFEFLTEEQEAAIKTVFENFDKDKRTRLKDKFLSIWDALAPTYKVFKEQLAKDNLCYEGMMKKEVIETLKNEPEKLIGRLKSDNYVIVGFNVLNETERQLFKFLKKNKKTYFYWDYDEAYKKHEAGRFITQNIHDFGNRFADHPEYYQNLWKKKNISFVNATTENAQTRYVSKWIEETVKDAEHLNENAVVLCNESALPSVLHSIPATLSDENNTELVTDKHTFLNVTMGFPLGDTLAYSYVQALLELQIHGKSNNGYWRYSYVADVLRHPFTRRLSGNASVAILSHLNSRNITFPSEKDILYPFIHSDEEDMMPHAEEFVRQLFTPAKSKHEITSYVIEMLKHIGISYKGEKNEALQKESIFTAYTVLNRVQSLLEDNALLASINNETLNRLIRQIMTSHSIPFHGEPAIGLQVMGVLETRNLDFKNVILLSCNEDMLPKNTHRASLIPYNLREFYGMTTMEKQVSLYAYYFYNLLQRAENITVMYNSSSDGLNKGEKSRFMMQMEIETKKILGPDNEITHKTFLADNEAQKPNDCFAPKTDELMARMTERFETGILSPTAINNYLRCPLSFYFRYVANYKDQDEVTEEVDNPTFGTIFHKCMEEIYRAFGDRQIQGKELTAIAEDGAKISRIVDEAFATEFFHKTKDETIHYNGEQKLNHKVLCKYVRNQLLFDAQSCPMRNVHVEDRITHTEIIKGRQINLGGSIDRYETLSDPVTNTDYIRIVDYKTGTNPEKSVTSEKLFSSSGDAKYHCQAMYYSYVMRRVLEKKYGDASKIPPIRPSLMYVTQALAQRKDEFKVNGSEMKDFADFEEDFHAMLKSTIEDIFDPSIPFSQCEDKKKCANCSFARFCRR
ncbi:MAG: PD-(D/E)XK nuclease family protein [Bacteroidaceae bacterium]|nr:PD-(D/E)XK nuclease family protein [Bacteroidaceae bacterium]